MGLDGGLSESEDASHFGTVTEMGHTLSSIPKIAPTGTAVCTTRALHFSNSYLVRKIGRIQSLRLLDKQGAYFLRAVQE